MRRDDIDIGDVVSYEYEYITMKGEERSETIDGKVINIIGEDAFEQEAFEIVTRSCNKKRNNNIYGITHIWYINTDTPEDRLKKLL